MRKTWLVVLTVLLALLAWELALSTSEARMEREGIRLGEDLRLDLAWRDRVGSVYTLGEGA